MNSEPSITDFVCKNFYVDDGLISAASDNEAINLMKKTQAALLENGKLRLHKIASNSKHILNAFRSDDLAKEFDQRLPSTAKKFGTYLGYQHGCIHL